MTHSRLPKFLGALAILAGAIVPATVWAGSDSAYDAAYGQLNQSYNKFFEEAVQSPGSTSLSSLRESIVGPAQNAFTQAMNKIDPAALGSRALASKPVRDFDLRISKDFHDHPGKSYTDVNIHVASQHDRPGRGPASSGPLVNDETSEPVVVDGSGVPKELTFPGAKAGVKNPLSPLRTMPVLQHAPVVNPFDSH